MGDGWETRRSRTPGHKDWAIIRLGDAGILESVEIDTAHFKGNFPESCELHAIESKEDIPSQEDEEEWTCILPRIKLGPHRQHYFQLDPEHWHDNPKPFTHVRLTIYPDGGIKRIRIIGKRLSDTSIVSQGQSQPSISAEIELEPDIPTQLPAPTPTLTPLPKTKSTRPPLPALPLTAAAFAPYGNVIQSYPLTSAPRGTKITTTNSKTALKFHRLTTHTSSYPPEHTDVAHTGIGVFRCVPPEGAVVGGEWDVKVLERHKCTDQTFVPMGTGQGSWNLDGETMVEKLGRVYLVIVALNGADDKPDLSTLRAFVATTSQGVTYGTGVWHHPMIALETTIEFACIETQIGTPDHPLDCEVVDITGDDVRRVTIPAIP
jgi:allantoicase